MANICTNTLVVIGLKEDSCTFARSLEQAVYGQVSSPDHFYSVVVREEERPEFCFETKWDPSANELQDLSEEFIGTLFLLSYSCWESGFRGQMVISDGKIIEHVHRRYGPAFLFADITNPLVSLWSPHIGRTTLEREASDRLQDAIAIVQSLKETLEDERFTDSPYRRLGDEQKVIRTRQQLSDLLEAMNLKVSQISFAGVLVTAADDESRTKG